MKKCSIIIAAYNEAELLGNCLESISCLDYPKEDFEVIVVDNNSTDNTPEIVQKFTQVLYLKEEKQGASYARNKGIALAKGALLVFLDADTKVSKKWLRNLTEPFNNVEVGAVGGAILPFDQVNLVSKYLGISLFMKYPRYGDKREVKGYPSCNLAVRKELIGRGFDTDAFDTYGEDKDICYRVLKNGYKVIFQPEARIYHRHPETLADLVGLMVKSSAGRVAFSKKYPMALDIIFFNLHIPLIYTLVLIYCLLALGAGAFFIATLPALAFLLYGGLISFARSGDPVLSFIVKPLFDVLSVYILYVSYQSRKLKRRQHGYKRDNTPV